MKKLLVITLLAIASSAYSQNKGQYNFDCDDLSAIFSKPYFAKYVESLKDTLIFVDTFKVFSCSKLLINGQPLVKIDEFTKEISHGDANTRYVSNDNKRFIAIWRCEKVKKRLALYFWELRSNRVCIVYLGKKKTITNIEVKYYGTF
jgi:hypothetical protein